jgi:peptidoglycan hydrolase-like protein with peptidoglycan-binding domain
MSLQIARPGRRLKREAPPMTDTQWADISEFQIPANDTYPHNFICIRSNDGNHVDRNIQANLSWCRSRRASGKLWGFIVYYFYRPGADGAQVLMSQVGTPDPRMVVMIDVESAGGQVSGNQSAAINAQFDELASWLGDQRRVIGYGNPSDLGTLWPSKPAGIRLVIASYGSKPSYPGMFGHQYTDRGSCGPFGTCDMNSADGMSQQDLEAMFGFSGTAPPSQAAGPAFPYPATDYLGVSSSDPHCHSGSTGAPDSGHVRAWQQQMAARGWNITADGHFGSQSQSVCRQFQQQVGLSVDGLVGSKTWQASWSEPVT